MLNKVQLIGFLGADPDAVSYTHLDVYKRQSQGCSMSAPRQTQILPPGYPEG